MAGGSSGEEGLKGSVESKERMEKEREARKSGINKEISNK